MSTPGDLAPGPSVSGPVRIEQAIDGKLWRVILDAPPGNLLDEAMVEALGAVLTRAQSTAGPQPCTLLFEGAGAHFSYGASIQAHRRGRIERFLPSFHGLVRDLADSGLVLLAAVRGQCLGGALELVAFCQRVFSAPGATLGLPEIHLGVFPPLAAACLSERIGLAATEDLCLTGRTLRAEAALAIGLVDEVAIDPTACALAYHDQHLAPHSASSLRIAARAARWPLRERLLQVLPAIERLYLEELLATDDAHEGIEAFLARRPPRWQAPSR